MKTNQVPLKVVITQIHQELEKSFTSNTIINILNEDPVKISVRSKIISNTATQRINDICRKWKLIYYIQAHPLPSSGIEMIVFQEQ